MVTEDSDSVSIARRVVSCSIAQGLLNHKDSVATVVDHIGSTETLILLASVCVGRTGVDHE